jgi:hypothetical protein
MDIEFRWLDIGGGRPLIPQLRTRWPGDANWPWSAIPQSGIPIVGCCGGSRGHFGLQPDAAPPCALGGSHVRIIMRRSVPHIAFMRLRRRVAQRPSPTQPP